MRSSHAAGCSAAPPQPSHAGRSTPLPPAGTRSSISRSSFRRRTPHPRLRVVGDADQRPGVVRPRLHGVDAVSDRRKAFVLPTALDGVRFVVDRAKETPEAELLVIGHTDPTEDEPNGAELSLDRVRSVVAFLTADAAAWLPFYGNERRLRVVRRS